MKTIFLTEDDRQCRAVYDETARAQLRGVMTDETVFRKADLLAAPERFADTETIFFTWGMPAFTEAELRRCLPRLKHLFYAAGSVQKFARPFLNGGVRVFSAWAANAIPVAEYTVAQIVLANKDFYAQSRLMSQGKREEAHRRRGSSIGNYRQSIGLLGCGMIGSRVAEMLQAYDVSVRVYDPFLPPEKAAQLRVTPCTLPEIFAECHVVSNHLANLPATRGILRYEHFASMQPFATFLNTGRGAQVIEPELVRALAEREDLTAVLDVTDPEPPEPGHPFYTLPNCILTPHIAGSLGREVTRMAAYMLQEFERVSAGRPAQYEVTAAMLETMA